MTTSLEGWYYCYYTDEQTEFVRDLISVQAQMNRRTSRESALGQCVFKSDILHPCVMLYFLEYGDIDVESALRLQCQGERVRELKHIGVQDQLGRLHPSAPCPFHHRVPL